MEAYFQSGQGPSNPIPFKEKLQKKILQTGTYLCVGIDPPLSGYSSFLEQERTRLGPKLFLEKLGLTMLEAAADKVPAIKPQSAYFEAYGSEGFAALETLMKKAQKLGILTILDAKRGDISSTMAAYGRMAFETMQADALTITPYMGLDVIEPLWPWLQQGKGVYVVWVSSNPSGDLVQNPIAQPLLQSLKEAFKSYGCEGALGLVLGATKAEVLPDHLYDQISGLPLLMPGVGAQGGQITDRIIALKEKGQAVLIPESRSLLSNAMGANSWESFNRQFRERIESETSALPA